MDMSEPIVQDLERLENESIAAYDGHLQREVNQFVNFYVLDTVLEETELQFTPCHRCLSLHQSYVEYVTTLEPLS